MGNPRLSIIPAGAITDRSLEPRDLQVLCLLGRHTDHAGWCRRSQVKMAGELHCSRGSVQNSLERLVNAGWVEKQRRDKEVEEAGKHPSRSYAYRVLLDHDQTEGESDGTEVEVDEPESYAETASDEGGCQPVGTGGANPELARGANPGLARGANTYVGTKNDPSITIPLEREGERDARARLDRKEKFVAKFQQRWPTAAADDQQRTRYAADALTEAEEAEALAGIDPFLAELKRLKRQNVVAGWRYLEEKRWTLLEAPDKAGRPSAAASTVHPPDSPGAKAIKALHEIAGRIDAFFKIWRRPDGTVSFPLELTPRLLAFANVPDRTSWVALTHQQAGAWEALLRTVYPDARILRTHMREGSMAPWPWPPRVDGTLSPESEGEGNA